MPLFTLNVGGLTCVPVEPYYWEKDRGSDVLKQWPHEYSSQTENAKWTAGVEWRDVPGCHGNVKHDTGFNIAAVNYSFVALYDHIPSSVDTRSRSFVSFDGHTPEQFAQKKQTYYGMLQYIHNYPKHKRMLRELGMSYSTFRRYVKPCIYSVGGSVSFLDRQLRLWEYNHVPHFPQQVLTMVDGTDVEITTPGNRYLQRCTRSAKYKTFCVKYDLETTITGFPIDYNGLFMGVRHDSRIHNEFAPHRTHYAWEYGLGDKAYVGCPDMLTEYKKLVGGAALNATQMRWNLTIQHYRGRIEHMIKSSKRGAVLGDGRKWRGSFSTLAAIARFSAHMSGLEERMLGPRYPSYGPWPVVLDALHQRNPIPI
jgi:hypothetical protein